ncbi:histidine utilization repressor (plasmid) [Rhizobium leguminosarum]|jgi:GntR family histidine utilization transcriptional repressor|uniref:Histidine utilization repressor n=1 Tax=Rhizobium leguminosarum TaxID=384 RepID=A0A7M3DLC7_RHILE|nr:histidine utilization repressor [Rhizobium leguminosarum]MDH6663117.1 GntR family histidine utilization transcriptional repressor [Rhizobium sophorae]MBA9034411.1 GntR family histidine utilization transcriptional repressor [Rhizobium leguminosarum]MBB4526044.1 GntR family histidine utilization transcriptional repressor [Rhizobium leguminosarum]MBB4589540.1 GntR family histidine utilization transcriptional repressor [Rhizobium leguminosarum]MBY5474015.1 histidine utilization repressor [Rhizo
MKRPGEMKRELAENDSTPLYAGVKQVILDRIQSGEWPPKYRVPSENELVVELGVSKMTANRALRELANEGELVRIQGVGSFVAERKGYSALFEVRNIAEEIAERGHVHEASVVVLAQETASPEVADALELAIGAAVFHSLIVHSENGVPVQIEDRFVHPEAAPEYLDQDFSTLTPNAYLTAAAPLSGSEHVVEAAMPQAWECKLLTIMKTEPCLTIRRRTWSAKQVVSTARLVYPGHRYRLEARSGKMFEE